VPSERADDCADGDAEPPPEAVRQADDVAVALALTVLRVDSGQICDAVEGDTEGDEQDDARLRRREREREQERGDEPDAAEEHEWVDRLHNVAFVEGSRR